MSIITIKTAIALMFCSSPGIGYNATYNFDPRKIKTNF